MVVLALFILFVVMPIFFILGTFLFWRGIIALKKKSHIKCVVYLVIGAVFITVSVGNFLMLRISNGIPEEGYTDTGKTAVYDELKESFNFKGEQYDSLDINVLDETHYGFANRELLEQSDDAVVNVRAKHGFLEKVILFLLNGNDADTMYELKSLSNCTIYASYQEMELFSPSAEKKEAERYYNNLNNYEFYFLAELCNENGEEKSECVKVSTRKTFEHLANFGVNQNSDDALWDKEPDNSEVHLQAKSKDGIVVFYGPQFYHYNGEWYSSEWVKLSETYAEMLDEMLKDYPEVFL